MRFFTRLVLVSLVVNCFVARIYGAADQLVFRRATLLQKGINLSGWFASTGDLSSQHTDTYIGSADLRLIHDVGFTFVRIGVDPAALMQHGLKSAETANLMYRLDLATTEAQQAGLAVEICVFPTDAWKHELETQRGADNFLMLWRFLAQHFATLDPDHIFLELMNEPELSDPYRWMGMQAAAVDAIRKIDKAHTIVATAARYSGIDDLLHLQPVNDSNVIYDFHFYEPYPFTHQGATWGSTEWNYFQSIPYPATPDALKAALASVQDDSARYMLFLYGAGGWNAQAMLGRLQFARDWAMEHHVPILCDEFGAYRTKAPADSRARYIRDVRLTLDRLQIGWAMWDYRGDFGLVTHDGPRSVADPAIVDALGLSSH